MRRDDLDRVTATRMGVGLLAFCTVFAATATDSAGNTARVRLIAGLAEEKAYLPRFHAVRALEKEAPLTGDERSARTTMAYTAYVYWTSNGDFCPGFPDENYRGRRALFRCRYENPQKNSFGCITTFNNNFEESDLLCVEV